MINKIKVENFLSHEKSELILNKGINVIIGLPQSGKSSVIRGLELLRKNRPSGGNYHSNFAKNSTKVEVEIGKNIISIEKQIKDKKVKKGIYKVNEKENSSFGSKIPEDIINILNLDDINFQTQFDQPFMVFSSAGDVAKEFNKVTNLEKADIWNKNLTKDVNKCLEKITDISVDLENTEIELAKYSDIESMQKFFDRYNSIEEKLNDYIYIYENIEDSILQLEEIEVELKNLNKIKETEKHYYKLITIDTELNLNLVAIEKIKTYLNLENGLKNINIINETEEYYSSLMEINDELIVCSELIEEIEKYISISDEIKDIKKIEILENKYTKYVELEKKYFDSIDEEELLENFINIKKSINGLEKKEEEEIDNYKKILSELKICPTCFTSITNEKIKEIGESL